MIIELSDYTIIKSKKDNKTYLKYWLLVNKRKIHEGFTDNSEILEEFCKNNVGEDISNNVNFSFNTKINGFIPYINYPKKQIL